MQLLFYTLLWYQCISHLRISLFMPTQTSVDIRCFTGLFLPVQEHTWYLRSDIPGFEGIVPFLFLLIQGQSMCNEECSQQLKKVQDG